LLLATLNLHYDTAALLIARGADISRWDWWGRTALYNCIDLHLPSNTSRGDLPSTGKLTALDVARTLLAKGAYVDMRLKHEPPFRGGAGDRGYTDGTADSRVVSAGSTALHKAVKAGDVDAVRLLLQYKARADIANIMYEVTPILAAGGVWRVYGIFKDQPLSGQYTTGAEAAEIVKLLMDSGANIRAFASNGQNIAHGAAKAGWNEVLQLAWNQGVDFTAKDVGGLTPRDLAQMKGHAETVELIDKLLGNKPRDTSKVVVGDAVTADAIIALLPSDVTVNTATGDQIAQAAVTLAFNMKGNLESNISQTMVVLGEMTREGKAQAAPRYGDNTPAGRFYLKVMNMASSNLDVSSKTYYGLSTLDLTRIAAAARAGQNALNGARSDAITRKRD
jgi:ankyrin repeat protein